MGECNMAFRLYHFRSNYLNSFKYSGISSEIDGREDHQFRGDEDLEKGNDTIELENEEAFDQEDHYVTSSGSDQ